jgi:hypothetical protein
MNEADGGALEERLAPGARTKRGKRDMAAMVHLVLLIA